MFFLKPIHSNYINGTWEIPSYKTTGSAGLDFKAAIDEPIELLKNNKSVIIPLGLSIWINNPEYMLVLTPKSGIGCKLGLNLGNTIGIVDSDYQGELKICAINNGDVDITIYPGSLICQGIFIPVMQPKLQIVTEFEQITDRNVDGGINRI